MNNLRSPGPFAGLSQFLYNHNPLYLISALLVLFGIFRAMPADANAAGSGLLLGLLCAYTVVMAVAGYAIIRFGQVWNDARTILITLVLLFVATSTLFDQIALDRPAAGAQLLVLGFAFVVLVSESVLRGLGLALRFRYRGPYYLLLALLFGYPIFLSLLSKAGIDDRMPLFVASFPIAVGLAMLTLLPAARSRKRNELPERHPWRWPMYPWSLFVVLLVAAALRTYSFSCGFESGQFRRSSFEPYFLLPIFFSAVILFLELAIAAKNVVAQRVALAAPICLLFLALPGHELNPIAGKFLSDLSGAFASPIQLTAAALAIYYAIAWFRGLRLGEIGLLLSITTLAVVNRQTVDGGSFQSPHWLPLAIAASIEIAAGLWHRSSWRGMVAASLATGMFSSFQHLIDSAPHITLATWAVALLGVMLLGAICNDAWSRFLRKRAWPLVPLVAAISASLEIDSVSVDERCALAGYLCCLSAIGLLYWYRAPALRRFVGAMLSPAILAASLARWLYLNLENSLLAAGLPWIACGAGVLAIALLVSFAKAGYVAATLRRVQTFGIAAAPVTRRIANGPPL